MIFNVDEAISAHLNWVARFLAAIKSGEKFDTETVARNDRCELGKFIHTISHQHMSDPVIQRLEGTHDNFHLIASEIAGLINEEHPDAARVLLSSNGKFYLASRQVILALEDFRAKFSL